MKCTYCNSEWQSHIEVHDCPFCGMSLTELPVFSDIVQTLCFVMDIYGGEVKKNPNRIIAYLSDLAPKLTKERRLLKMCVDMGIIAEFLSITDEAEKDRASRRAAALLNSEYFIEVKHAEEAVSWITAAVFRTGPAGRRISVPRAQLEKELSEQRECIQMLRRALEEQMAPKERLVARLHMQYKHITEFIQALGVRQNELIAQQEQNRELREELKKQETLGVLSKAKQEELAEQQLRKMLHIRPSGPKLWG